MLSKSDKESGLFWMLTTAFALVAFLSPGSSAAEDDSAVLERYGDDLSRLHIDYVGYRAAEWETDKVHEPENERVNQGGFVSVYMTNASEKSLQLRNWFLNQKEDYFYRLGGQLAWDRLYDGTLEPGEATVLEINGISDTFSPRKPFHFAFIDRNWKPCGYTQAELVEDPVQISYIRVVEGLEEVEIHVRNTGDDEYVLKGVEILGVETGNVLWRTEILEPSSRTIARITLKRSLGLCEQIIAKLTLEDDRGERSIFAHRNAFADYFPIGTWSNDPDNYQRLRQHHIETIVRGGQSTDRFYAEDAERFGFRSMVHTGVYPNVDTLRDLGDHPVVACWMLQDEPDWSYTPNTMLMSNEMTRKYNRTKPTFITLCRNVKFFEYAPIPDIPCMDHYTVTAPSSSKWPASFGTHVEETAYYTEDLKRASEPKPIWIWSQALAHWDERPKQPVPTPEELASQLVLNLSRGAKGILWFNMPFDVGDKYPETLQAVQRWGRVLRLLRDILLESEPLEQRIEGPPELDTAALVSWNHVVLCLTNLDYRLNETGYRWHPKKQVNVFLKLPSWIDPASAVQVTPDGVKPVDFRAEDGQAQVSLPGIDVCTIVLLSNTDGVSKQLVTEYELVLEDEAEEYGTE